MTQAIVNYRQAVDFLMGRIDYERQPADRYTTADLKLERMQRLLSLLDDPQQSLPAVHIAGTKGKGSTALMTAAVLSQAGYRVGVFTSPHLSRFEERMTVEGRMPDEAEVVALVEEVHQVVQRMRLDPDCSEPTFFEILTAMAWLYFRQAKADVVVLEVGLGGRLDATNLCHPVTTVITSISFDHTRILGRSLEQIATEKAGIIKPGVPVVCGVTDAGPRAKIQSIAKQRGAPLLQIGDEIQYGYRPLPFEAADQASGCGNLDVTIAGCRPMSTIAMPILGRHQAHNAALAAAVAVEMRKRGWHIPDDAILSGIARVRCPVRMEIVHDNPVIILDSAHNTASARTVVESVRDHFPGRRKGLIFATTKEKPVEAMLRQLLPEFDWVVLTQYRGNPRGLELNELVEIAQSLPGQDVASADNPDVAWDLVVRRNDETELICVTGSFFIAAEIRELLRSRQATLAAAGAGT